MSIETTLYTALSTTNGVTTLVSTRVYPMAAPDGTASPYISYQVITGTAYNRNVGAPMGERKIVQINCVGNSYSSAKAVAEAVKAALNVTYGHLVSERDDYFSQTEQHRIMLDFSLIG